MTDLMAQRNRLRQTLRQRRQALTPQQQEQAAQRLTKKLLLHPAIEQAHTIAYYLANDGEINLMLFAQAIQQQGKRLCLPRLHPFAKKHLLFLKHTLGAPLSANRFGIPEPILALPDVVPITQVDVILLPLVGYDLAHNRLGMGGGFYDRTLALWHQQRHPQTALIGVAHRCQEVSQLPVMPWDVPLDQVLTD